MSSEDFGRVPPQNNDAEMAILGSMLLDKEAIYKAVESLQDDYFYKEAHQKIYLAIIKLFDENKAVDLITLMEELKNAGLLDEVGGPAYLAHLTSIVPTTANFAHYARIVKEKALTRALINAATQIVGECYEKDQDVEGLIDKAGQIIFDLISQKKESRVSSFRDLLKGSIDTIESLSHKAGMMTGLETGFKELDMNTLGLQPSDLIIVAGRPSMGKSAFASSIIEHAAVTKKLPVAFFSLEMSKENVVQRILCSHARLDIRKMRGGFMSGADWSRTVASAGKLSDAPIYIDDQPAISVLELRAKARRMKTQHDIKLIVLDYMQLMQGPARSENRQQEISEISRSLKALARELSVPLIAISQLNRAVEQRTDRRPQLSDLRESGAIEQDADLVLFLFREEVYNRTDDNKGAAEVIIAKQRNGPTANLKLTFIGEYMRFENQSSKYEEFEKEEQDEA